MARSEPSRPYKRCCGSKPTPKHPSTSRAPRYECLQGLKDGFEDNDIGDMENTHNVMNKVLKSLDEKIQNIQENKGRFCTTASGQLALQKKQHHQNLPQNITDIQTQTIPDKFTAGGRRR